MTIKGALEHVSKAGVSGWCVDDASDAPAMVDVIVGPVLLGTVRADMSRDDIHRSLGRRLAGFRLPFTSTLFRLLPHGAGVEAVSKGIQLPFAKHQRFSIDNPGQDDAEHLLDRLNDGYIISPKSGGIFRPLKGSQLEEKAFRALEQGNQIFRELFAKEFFICYGTLLGCIRANDFIEHDDDIDVCFLAGGNSLDAAATEFAQIVASLRALGETVTVVSQIQFHWLVAGIEIDVFMAWMEGGRLYSYNVGRDFSIDRIYPLVRQKFKGRDVLIPRDSEGLLEVIYGPNWRIPDPHFQWRPTLEARQMMREVRGTSPDRRIIREQIERHWTTFYSRTRTSIPSPFAASVAVELPDECAVCRSWLRQRPGLFFLRATGTLSTWTGPRERRHSREPRASEGTAARSPVRTDGYLPAHCPLRGTLCLFGPDSERSIFIQTMFGCLRSLSAPRDCGRAGKGSTTYLVEALDARYSLLLRVSHRAGCKHSEAVRRALPTVHQPGRIRRACNRRRRIPVRLHDGRPRNGEVSR